MLIHLWVPDIDPTKGGIQAYSAQVRDALIHLGHDCRVIAHNGQRSRFIRQALSAALWHKPDLIFTTHLNFAPLARAANLLRRIPYAVSLHGREAWVISNPQIRQALRSASALLPVSEFTQCRVQETLENPLPRIELLFNTVDHQTFRIGNKSPAVLKRHGIAPDAPVILTIGRLASADTYKGQDAILRALPLVLRRHPDAIYLVVGEGNDRKRLEKIAAGLQVSERVRFTGHVPSAELPAYYQSCDVFAMPSRGEGFGIVYLEAMACGKPVISSNLDAGRDALDGGRLGVVANPNLTKELADALLACLEKTHPNRIIFEPEILRVEMLKSFGLEIFQRRLATIMESFQPCAE